MPNFPMLPDHPPNLPSVPRSNLTTGKAGIGAGAQILLGDGSWKAIEAVKLGERIALGGEVVGRAEVRLRQTWWLRGIELAGSHLIFGPAESGSASVATWYQAYIHPQARPVSAPANDGDLPVMVQLATTDRILIVRGTSRPLICADCDGLDPKPELDTPEKVLAVLNGPLATTRNQVLAAWERRLEVMGEAQANHEQAGAGLSPRGPSTNSIAARAEN